MVREWDPALEEAEAARLLGLHSESLSSKAKVKITFLHFFFLHSFHTDKFPGECLEAGWELGTKVVKSS